MSQPSSILLAEDDECDVMLLQRAFKEAGLEQPVHVARDGQEAIDYFEGRRLDPNDHLPALTILDLKMPRLTGLDVLKWMRMQPVLGTLPVVIFSSSSNRDDIEQAYALGANAFLVKPPSLTERVEVAVFIKQWLKLNQSPLASREGFKIARSVHAIRSFSS